MKIFFPKETIDQKRFSLEHFRSIFNRDYSSLLWVRNARLLIKLGRLGN